MATTGKGAIITRGQLVNKFGAAYWKNKTLPATPGDTRGTTAEWINTNINSPDYKWTKSNTYSGAEKKLVQAVHCYDGAEDYLVQDITYAYSLALNPLSSFDLNVGSTKTVKANLRKNKYIGGFFDSYEDLGDITSDCTWTESSGGVNATISGSTVTGKKGKDDNTTTAVPVTITAVYTDPTGKTINATVTANIKDVISTRYYITVSDTSDFTLQYGATVNKQLTATAYSISTKNGSDIAGTAKATGATISWSSSNTAKATVSSTGNVAWVAGKGDGTENGVVTVITASCSGYPSVNINCITKDKITYSLAVTLASSNIYWYAGTKSTTATAKLTTTTNGIASSPVDVTSATSFSSSKTGIATVSGNTITGKATGSATITGVHAKATGTTTVTVKDYVTYGLSIPMTHADIYWYSGSGNTTYQLIAQYATVTNGNVVIEDVTSKCTWTVESSGVTTIATVSSTGLVTGKATGGVNVKATYNGYTDSCPVNVNNYITYSLAVTLANSSIYWYDGTKSTTATATLTTTTNGNALNTDVTSSTTFTSSNTGIATVNGNTITGKATGSTIINGLYSLANGTATITVNDYISSRAHSIDITDAAFTLQYGGTVNKQLTVKTYDIKTVNGVDSGSAYEVTGKTVTWSSSNSSKALVSSTGKVIWAAGAGDGTENGVETTITATYSGKTDTVKVTTKDKITYSLAVTLASSNIYWYAGTKSTTATAKLTTTTNGSASTTDVTSSTTFSPSNTGIVTISGNTITGKATGSTTITGVHAKASGTATITVKDYVTYGLSIPISTVNIYWYSGSGNTTYQLAAQYATVTNGVTASVETVTSKCSWTVESSSSTTIATVSTGGLVTGKATGGVIVKATYNGYTASCAVNVNNYITYSLAVTLANSSIYWYAGTKSTTATAKLTTTTNGNASTTDVTSSTTFTSSNTGIATVSGNTITGKATGSTIINGLHSLANGTATITINDYISSRAHSIDITDAAFTLQYGGTTSKQLTAKTYDIKTVNGVDSGSAYEVTGKTITWSSSNSNKASVSSAGKVSWVAGAANGTENGVETTITATYSGKTDTVKVTTKDKITYSLAVTLASSNIYWYAGTKTTTATAKLTTTTNGSASTTDVTSATTFNSSNTGIATVSGSTITGKATGSTTITGVHAKASGSTTITVKDYVTHGLSIPTSTVNIYWYSGSGKTTQQLVAQYGTVTNGVTTSVIDVASSATWALESSSSSTIATVSSSGLVTGKATGGVQVKATYNGYTASCTVNVSNYVTYSLALDKTSASIFWYSGANVTTTKLKANYTTITNGNASTTDVASSASWATSDSSKATVSAGTVTGKGTGTATITATYGGKSASCTVRVDDYVTTSYSLFLNKSTASIYWYAGTKTVALTATYRTTTTTNGNAVNSDSNVTSSSSCSWTTSNSAKATVSAGTVTGKGTGSATITATYGGKSASCTVTVNDYITYSLAVTLANSSIYWYAGTKSTTATAKLTTTTNGSASTTDVTSATTFISSNTGIATVSGSTITGKATGTATITGTHAKATGSTTITVNNYNSSRAYSVDITDSAFTLQYGGTTSKQLTVKTYDINTVNGVDSGSAYEVTGKTVTWASSNTAKATVSSAGKVSWVAGAANGTENGVETTITATYSGKTDTVKVTTKDKITYSLAVSLSPASIYWYAGTKTSTAKATLTTTTNGSASSTDVTSATTFTSSNTAKATVSGSTITGKATGTATITGTHAKATGTATITVVDYVSSRAYSVDITDAAFTLQYGGTTSKQLTAKTYDIKTVNGVDSGSAYEVTGKTITWSSSNSNKASVSSAGKVSWVAGAANGTENGIETTITATYSGKTDTVKVTTKDKITYSLAVTLASSSVYWYAGTKSTTATAKLTTTTNGSASTTDVTSATTFSSSNTGIATVSGSTITGKATGSATITGTHAKASGTTTITVKDYVTYALSIPTSTVNIYWYSGSGNTTYQLVAQYATVTNGVTSNVATVTSSCAWTIESSSSTTIATVSSSGLVTGKATGGVNVRATYNGYTASCAVNVSNYVTYSLALDKTTASIYWYSGSNATTTKLKATLTTTTNGNASTSDVTSSASWSSNNTSKATVSAGTVTGKATGSATITATYSGKSASCTVTVKDYVTTTYSLFLSASTAGIYWYTGTTTANLTATYRTTTTTNGTASNSDTNVTSSATWATSSSSIATVSAGKVTGKGTGTATITATYSGKSASCIVTVKDYVTTTYSLLLNQSTASIYWYAGTKTVALTATYRTTTTTNGNAVNSDTNVTSSASWTTSSSTYATVSAGTVTGKKTGSATITATYSGKSASCTVTVNDYNSTRHTKIVVSGSNLTLQYGGTTSTNLTATFYDIKTVNGVDSGSEYTVTGGTVSWSSNKTGNATVNSSGKVSWVAGAGDGTENGVTVTITAACSGWTSGTIAVTTKDKMSTKHTKIVVSGSNLTLQYGGTTSTTLTATFYDIKTKNGANYGSEYTVTGGTVSWSSNKTGNATVNSSGKVSWVAGAGDGTENGVTVTITAACSGWTSGTIPVITKDKMSTKHTKIAVSGSNLTLQYGGTTSTTLTATFYDIKTKNGANYGSEYAVTGGTVSWSSNKTGNATVNSSGKVSWVAGANNGTENGVSVTITAACSGWTSGTITVTTKDKMSSKHTKITLSSSTTTLQYGGTTSTNLVSTFYDIKTKNGANYGSEYAVTGGTITWSSNKTANATVSGGTVTFVKGANNGTEDGVTVTITAACSGWTSGTINITTKDKITNGSTVTLTAYSNFKITASATSVTVTGSSSPVAITGTVTKVDTPRTYKKINGVQNTNYYTDGTKTTTNGYATTDFTLASGDSSKASISGKTVNCLNKTTGGNVTITATGGSTIGTSLKATCTISITCKWSAVSVTPSSLIVNVNKSSTISCYNAYTYTNGTSQGATPTAYWSSANTSVASISASPAVAATSVQVTGKALGSTQITATYSPSGFASSTATCNVQVTAANTAYVNVRWLTTYENRQQIVGIASSSFTGTTAAQFNTWTNSNISSLNKFTLTTPSLNGSYYQSQMKISAGGWTVGYYYFTLSTSSKMYVAYIQLSSSQVSSLNSNSSISAYQTATVKALS